MKTFSAGGGEMLCCYLNAVRGVHDASSDQPQIIIIGWGFSILPPVPSVGPSLAKGAPRDTH